MGVTRFIRSGQASAGRSSNPAVLVAVLLAAASLPAWSAIALFTVPNGLDGVEGDSASSLPFGDASACTNGFRYQQILNGDQGIFGSIGSIALRLDGMESAIGPLTVENVVITLSSTDRTAATMSSDFDENVGLDRLVVWDDDLELLAGTDAMGTNPFDLLIVDGGGFRFGDEGGNLLIDITATDCAPGASFEMDAVSGDADTRALFAGDRNATSGSFADGLVAELVASTPPPVPPLYDCPAGPGIGDQVTRGFYLEDFPDDGLGRVRLTYSGDTVGRYVVELIARQGQYDGAIVGAEAVAIDVGDTNDEFPVTFDFRNAPVGMGTDITFTHRLRQKPDEDARLFYDIGDAACSGVTQTNGTNPPLDTVRRDRVGILVIPSDPDVRRRGLGGNFRVVDRAAVGFMIDVTDQDQLVAIWFTYDDDGTQQWMIGSTSEFPDNDIGMDLFKPVGPTFTEIRQPGFNNGLISIDSWGRMYIRFTDCNTGTVTYESEDFGSGEFQIERIYETEDDFCR